MRAVEREGGGVMAASTHRVEVVPVVLEKHPNADSLSIVRVFGFTVCVRTSDWIGRDIGAYIQPDSVVDSTRPEFAFLARHERIKVKKLRGVVSMGLLMPAPDGAEIGDDVAEQLGVTHYEPQIKGEPGTPGGQSLEATTPPSVYAPKYDVESARRYARDVMIPCEPIIATEKVHGANARWCFDGEKFHAGSRNEWKLDAEGNMYWSALRGCESLLAWLTANPGAVVYGEVFGKVQDLNYGRPGRVDLVVFDIMRGCEWMSAQAARAAAPDLPWVPTVYEGAFDWEVIEGLAEGPSLIPGADHVREGIVFKPLTERTDPTIGRVCLKVVGNGYLERA